MGIYDNKLIELRGYRAEDDDVYIVNRDAGDYLSFDYIRSLIIEMTTTLRDVLYRDANISTYVTTLQNATFGPTIRKAIYDIFKELARVSGIYIGRELASIRLAHFGKDMRQPLYDALVKLGIEQDLYVQTTGDDYIWYEDSGNVTIVRYIGPTWPYIIMPETIDGNTVTTVSSLTFNGNKTIMGVKFPANATSI